MKSRETGRLGERLAADYLKQCGYQIIDTNYHCRGGEIDIVASRDGSLVFVEVKARRTSSFGTPEESVTDAKKKRLIEAALSYRQQNEDLPVSWRIDFVSVIFGKQGEKPRIELIENAVTGD